MNKRVSVALTSALLTAGLMLGACGAPANNSGAQSSAAETTSTQSTTESTKVDVSKAIIGDWKSAQYEADGITVTGSISSVVGSEFTLSFAEDGKGTFGFAGESVTFSWKAKDDTTATLTFDKTSDSGVSVDSVNVTYYPELNALSMSMATGDMDGTITFTADGTLGDPVVDLSKAKAVTSIDQIAGTWKLTAIGASDVIMAGDASALVEATGGAFSTTFVIEADGKFTGGITAEYTGKINVSDKGATIEENGVTLATLKLYNESLIMDMSEVAAVQTFTVYSK